MPSANSNSCSATTASNPDRDGSRMAVERILLFGGSFDPLHCGHLIVSRYVAEHMGLARIILIPSAAPPHKLDRVLSPATHRLAMCQAAAAEDPLFEVSDCELRRPGPNYTIHTIEHFRTTCGDAVEYCWLIGMDSLAELPTWHRAAELVEACTIITAARPGYADPVDTVLATCFSPAQVARLRRQIIAGPRIDISGTDIRARVATGRSIRYLVPEPVRKYIAEHSLYRAASS
jgi:nicotinate-nucleotide adenylyltransferase